jgi:acetyl esterase/lipase
MLDDRTCTREDPNPHAGEFIWTPQSKHLGWSSLIGGEPGADHVSPYAAAARAESLAGLPPAFIATAALDLFVDEDMDYARRLFRAGVPTELHVYPGAYHGFDSFADAPVSRQARADSLAALRRNLSVKAGSNAY